MVRSTRPRLEGLSAARRSKRLRETPRRAAPAAAAPSPSSPAGLTTRAAVLGLVLCALVVSAALPLREFLSQRARIAQLEQDQSAQRARVVGLEQERRLLDDPAYVASLARERLHYVRPGETAYVVVAPEGPDAGLPEGAGRGATAATTPWYSQLWGSVREADRPAPP